MSAAVIKKWKQYSQVHSFQMAPHNRNICLTGDFSLNVPVGYRWAADQHQVGGIQLKQPAAKPKQQ